MSKYLHILMGRHTSSSGELQWCNNGVMPLLTFDDLRSNNDFIGWGHLHSLVPVEYRLVFSNLDGSLYLAGKFSVLPVKNIDVVNKALLYHYIIWVLLIRICILKEYSVILTTSFYDMNQKIKTIKAYFQNFSWFQCCVFKLCMIMCVSLLP